MKSLSAPIGDSEAAFLNGFWSFNRSILFAFMEDIIIQFYLFIILHNMAVITKNSNQEDIYS